MNEDYKFGLYFFGLLSLSIFLFTLLISSFETYNNSFVLECIKAGNLPEACHKVFF